MQEQAIAQKATAGFLLPFFPKAIRIKYRLAGLLARSVATPSRVINE
ncbi:hypothetical protein SAMN05660293_03744 [Dyadobacter psychrophilus]|uniref:Uncharacterized protein n=1 Tax=Dyadobacter psychrophilus TaxID=651661 RepID=A0A1T5G715_9BACT|nr:hypothetical protein SAMN05660293_03744 [Dyadobacter psychrophilus]